MVLENALDKERHWCIGPRRHWHMVYFKASMLRRTNLIEPERGPGRCVVDLRQLGKFKFVMMQPPLLPLCYAVEGGVPLVLPLYQTFMEQSALPLQAMPPLLLGVRIESLAFEGQE